MLMHHADPMINGIPWGIKIHRLALYFNNSCFLPV